MSDHSGAGGLSPETRGRIEGQIAGDPVVLYMKGTSDQPLCGFSAVVVQILREHGAAFREFNVLADPELREGVKEFSDWPTIPQLYVRGEFVGGSDIVREMHRTGELAELLRDKGVAGGAPS